MTTISSKTIEQLIHLDNLIHGENNSIDKWLEAFPNEKELKETLIDEINYSIKKEKLNEDITYEDYSKHLLNKVAQNAKSIYDEAMKAIKEIPSTPPIPPKPKPTKRYDESDDYFFKHLKLPYKSFDPLTDFHRENLRKKFNRIENARKNPFNKELLNHSKNFLEFHRTNPETENVFSSMVSPKEQNKQTIKHYHEWLENNDFNNQENLVNQMMENLETNPTHWILSFEELTNEGRHLLFPQLKKFFEDFIDSLPITQHYNFVFNVNGQWIKKPLSPELYNQLMENFTEENLIFNLDQKPPEYFYEKGSMELPEWSLFSAIGIETNKEGNRMTRGGDFFNYLAVNLPQRVINYLVRLQIFDSLTKPLILKNNKTKYVQREELNDCCFVYALQQTGEYSEDELNQIRLRINNRYQTHSAMDEICKEHKIHVKLGFIDESSESKNKRQQIISRKNGVSRNYLGVKIDEAKHIHEFNLFEHHYFIEERTPFSSYYIKHINELDEDKYNKRSNGSSGFRVVDPSQCIKSSHLVRILMKSNFFTPITYGQYKILNTVYYNDINDDLNYPLEYEEEYCTKLIAPEPRKFTNKENNKRPPISYWYCDFEADVSRKNHVPYMCVLQSITGRINKEFRGENCNIQLLDFLPDNSVVYFHNLAYDVRMLAKYGLNKPIIKGTKFMKGEIKYNDKQIILKDSLPILSCKLSRLPQMFNIPNVQKEIFPYKYYTLERLNEGVGVISEAGALEDKIWTPKDYELFNENIDKIDGCRIDENHFDLWKYASFYCQQDVKILRLGFNEFRKGFIKDFQVDPFKFISISSLANEVFNQRVYYPNKNLYKLGGHVRQFCARAVYGGRCMCAYNRKWKINKIILDFDAVSLYPSAMSRLYTVEGKPKVIQKDQLNMNFLSKQSAYIVEIKITKVNKHFAFPLIVRKVNGLNLNDDNLKENETVNMVVDNITLEDLINFQQIEFELIKGYYWDGKRDYSIQEEIKKIFNKRLQYKNEGNPLQELYKLIMNSCYGKTIERPVEKDYKIIHEGDELNNYWYRNYNKIIEDIKLADSDLHAVKTLRPIDKHFNFSLLGIQVLSMSKRIMNEVMCLAFDIGCHIYYQDTDSMHIECDDLPKLVDAFREKYNRELIGKQLGQFHSDFTSDSGRSDVKHAVESIFLMKKMYVDKLLMNDNSIEYMIRGKGLTLNSIRYAIDKFHNGSVMKLYTHLFNGNNQIFDLTKGQPMMTLNKDMTVSTNKSFTRKIKVVYEKGERKDYFKYIRS